MKMVKFIFKMAAISGIERHKMTVCAHTCTVDWSVQLCTEHHRNMQRKGRETEGVVASLMQVVHSGPFGLSKEEEALGPAQVSLLCCQSCCSVLLALGLITAIRQSLGRLAAGCVL